MRRRTKVLGAMGAVAALIVIGGGLLWYFVIRSDAPPEVSLAGALQSLTTPAAGATATATSTTTASPGGATTGGDLSGTWVPDTSQQTFLGYRVQEELARIGANTAVGRTPGVTGSVTIQGNTVAAATFEADMTKLKSDSNLRDSQLRNQAIEFARFPTATFVMSRPMALPDGLGSGQPVNTTLKGKLTLHGVTRDVEVPAQAQLKGGFIVVVGSLPIKFSDYSIAKPSAGAVLSIDDNGTMELQIFLKRA